MAVIISCSGNRNKPESKELNKSATIEDMTVKEWSKPYRNWNYYPELVIPSNPGIKGFEAIKMMDVKNIAQLFKLVYLSLSLNIPSQSLASRISENTLIS